MSISVGKVRDHWLQRIGDARHRSFEPASRQFRHSDDGLDTGPNADSRVLRHKNLGTDRTGRGAPFGELGGEFA